MPPPLLVVAAMSKASHWSPLVATHRSCVPLLITRKVIARVALEPGGAGAHDVGVGAVPPPGGGRVVGTGVVALSETDFITSYLFDDEGLATVADIDRTIEALPGMAGLGLGWRAVNQMRARRGLPPNVRLP